MIPLRALLLTFALAALAVTGAACWAADPAGAQGAAAAAGDKAGQSEKPSGPAAAPASAAPAAEGQGGAGQPAASATTAVVVQPPAVGQTFDLAGGKARVVRADALPFVDNDYSRLYVYEKCENPDLKKLRETCRLEEVVAAGKTELEKQALLLGWVRAQFPFGRPPREDMRNSLEIMEFARQGQTGHCVQYSALLVSTAASLGWVCRPLAFPRHSLNEIWSNQHRKWVMFDPTRPGYAEVRGAPANAWEIRQQWYERQGQGLVWVWTRHGKPPEREPPPQSKGLLEYFPRFCFIGYVPNTDWLTSPPDWARMFITKDKYCGETKWHTRRCPENPGVDPYFPIDQATPVLQALGGDLRVELRSLTPNFKEFRVRFDGGQWKTSESSFTWLLRGGQNKLEAVSVNKFGVEGPTSTVELEVSR